MNRDEWGQQVLDDLKAALANDLLTDDELRAVLRILRPVAERARHGGPTAAQIERN